MVDAIAGLGDDHTLTVLIVGIAAVLIAVIAFGRKIDAKVGKIHVQVHPNGGSSMADLVERLGDAVDRAERGIVRISKDQRRLAKRVGILEHDEDDEPTHAPLVPDPPNEVPPTP